MEDKKRSWKTLIKAPTSQRNLHRDYTKYEPARSQLQHSSHNFNDKLSIHRLRQKSKLGSQNSKSKIKPYVSVSDISRKDIDFKQDHTKKFKSNKYGNLQKKLHDVLLGFRKIVRDMQNQISQIMNFWVNEMQKLSKSYNISIDLAQLTDRINTKRNSGHSRISSQHIFSSRVHKNSQANSPPKLNRYYNQKIDDSIGSVQPSDLMLHSRDNFGSRHESSRNIKVNNSQYYKRQVYQLSHLCKTDQLPQNRLKLADQFKKFGSMLESMNSIISR